MSTRSKKQQKALADILFPTRKEAEGVEVLNIPPEQRRLHTDTYDFNIATIHDYLRSKRIVIPEFQRGYVWNRAQASRLIESLIIQCPIPVLYMDQADDGTLSVIDGNQRLMSIKLYLENGYKLIGLKAYPELEGYTFTDLDPRFQTHILNRTLRSIVILKDTHPQIKFDVFERLNTGSVQLNAQELRHGLNHRPLIERIDELAEEDDWLDLIGMKTDKRMRSSELILRFFALRYQLDEYRKPLAGFLNIFVSTYKEISSEDLEAWTATFCSTVHSTRQLLGKLAFRIYNKDLVHVSAMNAALYDAEMTNPEYQLIDNEGGAPAYIDANKILADRKYPSIKNIPVLFTGIGIENIFNLLSKEMRRNAELVLDSLNSVRGSIAHVGLTALTIQDVERHISDIQALTRAIDRIMYKHVTKCSGRGCWV